MGKLADKIADKYFNYESPLTPICPYCNQELHIDEFMEGGDGFTQKANLIKLGFTYVSYINTIYFCPSCRKLLGVNRVQYSST